MDITNFVDVSISRRTESEGFISGVRPVLLVAYTNSGASSNLILGLIDNIFTSTGAILDYTYNDDPVFDVSDRIYKEAEAFFRAGGAQLKIAIVNSIASMPDIVNAADDCIDVRVVPTTLVSVSYTAPVDFVLATAKGLASDVNGISEDGTVRLGDKNIFYDLTMVDWAALDPMPTLSDVDGLVVHLVNDSNEYVSARAMAYIANQNFKKVGVKEYLYTNLPNTNVLIPSNGKTETDILDAVGYGTGTNLNFNAYVKITNGVNAVLGGKDTAGNELVLRQNSIAVEEDLTKQLLTYLVENKPTFSSATISEVTNMLTDYLDNILNSGWISPVRISEEQAKTFVKNGRSYKLLSTGEFLEYGYKVVILPFSRQDIQERVFRDIFIFLATTRGIRTISLRGEML